MTARLSSEVGVAGSGVAESGGRHSNGSADAQRAADLIATLGAQNKAQREQIAALKSAITSLQQEFKAAEQVHEAAKASKNAELLDFMKAHAREQQTKQTVAQLRQANAAKWEQVKEEQAKLAVLGLQSAKLALEEAQAAERRRAHVATVEVVRQRAELAEVVLAEEVTAAAARLAEHDRRAAEAQQAEAAERARMAEAAEAAKAAEQAEAAERARRAEAPVMELLSSAPGATAGRAKGGMRLPLTYLSYDLSYTCQPPHDQTVPSTLLSAVSYPPPTRRGAPLRHDPAGGGWLPRGPRSGARHATGLSSYGSPALFGSTLQLQTFRATMPVYHTCRFRPTSSCTATPTATSSCSSARPTLASTPPRAPLSTEHSCSGGSSPPAPRVPRVGPRERPARDRVSCMCVCARTPPTRINHSCQSSLSLYLLPLTLYSLATLSELSDRTVLRTSRGVAWPIEITYPSPGY